MKDDHIVVYEHKLSACRQKFSAPAEKMEPEVIPRRREIVYPYVLETYIDGRKPRLFKTAGIKNPLAFKVDSPRKLSAYTHDFSYTEAKRSFEQGKAPDQPKASETKESQSFKDPLMVGFVPKSVFCEKPSPWEQVGGSHKDIKIKQSMRLMNLRNPDMSK